MLVHLVLGQVEVAKKSFVDLFCVFSHVFEQVAYGVAVVAGDSFDGSDSVFFDKEFAYFYDFFF